MDLNKLAKELTEMEGLKESCTVAQVKEIIALLGIRWRTMDYSVVMTEVEAILQRAGNQSQHQKG